LDNAAAMRLGLDRFRDRACTGVLILPFLALGEHAARPELEACAD
jgi:hypothetical protein